MEGGPNITKFALNLLETMNHIAEVDPGYWYFMAQEDKGKAFHLPLTCGYPYVHYLNSKAPNIPFYRVHKLATLPIIGLPHVR